jgi:cell wall-associated NlpC family hydrolase
VEDRSSASVATPRRRPWTRPLIALALTFATLGVIPAAQSVAAPQAPQALAPKTTAEVKAALAKLSSDAEIVAEQANDARVTLGKRTREFRSADAKARTIQVQYAKLSGEVRRVVNGAYLAMPFSQFTLMLTSTSPREFMDQLTALNALANRRGRVLASVVAIRKAALDAQTRAQSALTAARKAQADINAKKADLARRAKTLNTLLNQLGANDRSYGGGSDRGSRSSNRAPLTIVAATPAEKQAVDVALAQRGDAYSWGAAGPDQFDCSGLVLYAWGAAGVQLPHSSASMASAGQSVSRDQVRAGDLVVFYNPVHHVGLAISNTQMVHAPDYGIPVEVSNIDDYPFSGASRVG